MRRVTAAENEREHYIGKRLLLPVVPAHIECIRSSYKVDWRRREREKYIIKFFRLKWLEFGIRFNTFR